MQTVRFREQPRVAEFFAGIGLVRRGVESAGFRVVWANDIDPVKRTLYESNYPDSHFLLADVTDQEAVRGCDLPDIELATASFPCTDLSLAGNRAGLGGNQSGAFWGFVRVLREMGGRRPQLVMLENVPSFATSHGGADLAAAIKELNNLGYVCDLQVIDARHFVAQSRPRLFVIGRQDASPTCEVPVPSAVRPVWVSEFAGRNPHLALSWLPTPLLPVPAAVLDDVVDDLLPDHASWWDTERTQRFVDSLSPHQARRLKSMQNSLWARRATAYRRTRNGAATWEIRPDSLAGCLRTARGGSSKQALVEADSAGIRVRWLSAREYARLQGAPDFRLDTVSENRALFGLGDAVCVPVVAWIARECLRPLVDSTRCDGALSYA